MGTLGLSRDAIRIGLVGSGGFTRPCKNPSFWATFAKTTHPQQLGSNDSEHVVSGANRMANCTNPLDHGYINQISYVANGPPTKTRMVPSTLPTQMDMTSISNTMAPT
jgi:hypothetical protein